MKNKSTSDYVILKRLLTNVKAYWRNLVAIFILDMLSAPLALITPLPLMLAVDSIVGDKPFPWFVDLLIPDEILGKKTSMLLLIAILVVFITFIAQSRNVITWLLKSYTGEKITLDIRTSLLNHAQKLSFLYHDKKGTADTVYRIQYDVPSFQYIAIYGLTPFISAAFTLVGIIYITVNIDSQLALIALSISPLLVLTTQYSKKKLRSQWVRVKKLESNALSVVQEIMGALRIVKAYGKERHENERFYKHSYESFWATMRVQCFESIFGLISALITALGSAFVLYVGIQHVLEGSLTIGQLLLVLSYVTLLYDPLKTLTQQIASIQKGLSSVERVFDLFDEKLDVIECPCARSVDKVAGNIQFQDVSFSYNDRNQALSNISFKIPGGSRVGIIGQTGSGKTTLMSLLMRFFDPISGKICIDGVDIKELNLKQLRDQFAIVLQEPILLHGTIADNIAYSCTDVPMEKIIIAAKDADAHKFISKLPDGYETLVGERGMQLSGGERQRIALARAFLKNAPILILDEPTSAVDIKTEASIIQATKRLMSNKTTFMIAHRLSTLESCDLLIKLHEGRLIKFTRDVKKELESQ